MRKIKHLLSGEQKEALQVGTVFVFNFPPKASWMSEMFSELEGGYWHFQPQNVLQNISALEPLIIFFSIFRF